GAGHAEPEPGEHRSHDEPRREEEDVARAHFTVLARDGRARARHAHRAAARPDGRTTLAHAGADAAGSIALRLGEPRGRQGGMRWASALSQTARLEDAVPETAASIREALGGSGPDLVAAFVSAHHRPAYVRLGELIERQLPGSLVVGCTAFGVIGAGHEVEGQPALSLTAASLPGVDVQPFRVEELPSGTPEELRQAFGIRAEGPHLLLLADPLTLDASALVSS